MQHAVRGQWTWIGLSFEGAKSGAAKPFKWETNGGLNPEQL